MNTSYQLPTVQPKVTWALALTLRDKVELLQAELLKMPQADIVTLHDFEDGKYIRTMIAPPWSVIVGAEHKTPYKIILKKGTISVNIDDVIHTLTAPMEFDAPKGVKRVGRVYDEEVIWVDVYDNPDNCKDIAVIEDRLYVIPECGLLSNRQALEYNEPTGELICQAQSQQQ